MPKQKAVQTTKEELVNATFRMAAYDLYEIARTIDSVVNYGLDKGDIPELLLKLDEKGIGASMMDKAHVARISLKASSIFEKFEINAPGELCFNARDLLSVLKTAKKETRNPDGTIKTEGEMLTFSLDGAEVSLKMEHSDYTRTFHVSTIVPERSMVSWEAPKLEYTTRFSLSKSGLQKVLRDMAIVEASYVRFVISSEQVRVESGHDTTGTKSFTADLDVAPEKDSVALRAAYPLDFLVTFVDNLPKDVSDLKFSIAKLNDAAGPVLIDARAYDELTLMLAQRIELD